MIRRPVYVDGRMLEGEGTGVATYARTLVRAVARTGRAQGLVRTVGADGLIVRFLRASRLNGSRLRAQGADLVGRDIFRLAQHHFGLTGRVLRLRVAGPPAIVHWTYPVPLMIEGWANIYTVHDVIPLFRPDLSPIDPARHRRLLAAVGAVASRIVTVTEAARTDILTATRWAGDRVVNCSQAVEAPTYADALPAGLSDRGYFLFCGRIEPRKNLARLVAAHTASGCDLPLVIAGPMAEGGEAILRKLEAAPNARYWGYADRDTLLSLIAHARALLMPSLLEGFGLPIVEAMELGTPTLISRDKALAEVSAGVALAVDATDESDIANAIRCLTEDQLLRNELVARGRIRARDFSLDEWASRLEAVYADVD